MGNSLRRPWMVQQTPLRCSRRDPVLPLGLLSCMANQEAYSGRVDIPHLRFKQDEKYCISHANLKSMVGIRFPGVTHGHQGDGKDTTQQHKHCRANLRNKTEVLRTLLLLILLIKTSFFLFFFFTLYGTLTHERLENQLGFVFFNAFGIVKDLQYFVLNIIQNRNAYLNY